MCAALMCKSLLVHQIQISFAISLHSLDFSESYSFSLLLFLGSFEQIQWQIMQYHFKVILCVGVRIDLVGYKILICSSSLPLLQPCQPSQKKWPWLARQTLNQPRTDEVTMNSPVHAAQIWDNIGTFSVLPNITPEKSLHVGVMMGHWPNFTPVLSKLYPKQWGNDEPLNFFSFVWTNYSELKPLSDMVLWNSPCQLTC